MTTHHPYDPVVLGVATSSPTPPSHLQRATPVPAAVPPSWEQSPGAFHPPARQDHVHWDDAISWSSSDNGSNSRDARNTQLCPNDMSCTQVNDKDHQRQYSHTCRLFPCFHAHLKFHMRYFRHVPGQGAQGSSEDGTSDTSEPSGAERRPSRSQTVKQNRQARKALASVSFTHISRDVPGAKKIIVMCGSRAFEIWGDWSKVTLHTFKRYMYQVTGTRPACLVVKLSGKVLEDEVAMLADLGVAEGSQIAVDVDLSKIQTVVAVPTVVEPTAPRIPVAWL